MKPQVDSVSAEPSKEAANDVLRRDATPPLDLSIIVTSYETAGALRDCLAAVRGAIASLPERRIETIVVDNGSRDESLNRIAEANLPIRVLAGRRNRGFAVAVNQAARIARGNVLLLLNSDAEMSAEVLEGGLSALEHDARLGVWAPGLRHVDGRPQRSVHRPPEGPLASLSPKRWRATVVDEASSRSASGPTESPGWQSVDAVRGAVFFVRRALFDDLAGLDERFFFFLEETDFCVRVREAGARVGFDDRYSVVHRSGVSSKHRAEAATRIEYHRSLYLFLDKHAGEVVRRCVQTGRGFRNLVMLPFLLLAGIGSQRQAGRAKARGALVLWHLKGCPEAPSLAQVLEEDLPFPGYSPPTD